jgi:hypothetical protein
MLSLYFPSYLTAHPNMQFDFDGSYLLEIRTFTDDLHLVPPHLPKRMRYAVVGEVIWTESCAAYFSEILRSSTQVASWPPGLLCNWPPGATALCPGTGTMIEPSATEVHLFVIGHHMASSDNGIFIHGVFPRILTFEGFDRMRGSAEEKYVQKEATCETAASFWFRYRDTLDCKTREDFLFNLDCITVDASE